MPTIPSRFEVTLFTGDREYKGFGSNSLRFDGLQATEVPGPGSYGRPKAFHQDCTESVSWGIRGTGGFASRSTRFGARAAGAVCRGRGCPGPGAYDSTTSLRNVKEQKDFNQAQRSSSFADADTKSRAGPAEPMPGPGTYKPPGALQAGCAAQAAFKASGRNVEAPDEVADGPGPGEYYDGAGSSIAAAVDAASGPAFRQLTRPRIARVHKDLPAVAEKAYDVLGAFGDEVGKQCLGPIGLSANFPGPGQYSQDREDNWEGPLTGVGGSSSFQAGPKRTDWAPEEQKLLPGPGRYNPRLVGGINLTDAASSFKSATERNTYPEGCAPGPAYYKPSVPKEHKSFRMKPSVRQWLT